MAQARDGRQLSFGDVAAEGRRRKLEEQAGQASGDDRECGPVGGLPARARGGLAEGRRRAQIRGGPQGVGRRADVQGDSSWARFTTTVWLYRERLARAGVVEKLFGVFDAFLQERGYQAMGGQIIDASIVSVPTQLNSKEENAGIKAGDIPAGRFPAERTLFGVRISLPTNELRIYGRELVRRSLRESVTRGCPPPPPPPP